MRIPVTLSGALAAVGLVTCSTLLQAQLDPLDSGGPLLPEQAAFDVTYYDLALEVDPADSTIEGVATLVVTALEPLDRLVLDLDPRLAVRRVESGPPTGPDTLRVERRGGRLRIGLAEPLRRGDAAAVRIAYGGRPRVAPRPPWDGGFTWARTPSGAPWVATSCFGEGADVWRPVKDHPSDEPDSTRLRITVPDPLVVAANGRLERVELGDGRRTYHWFVSTPINNYGVALNIAPYETLETNVRSVAGDTIPVVFWVLPEHADRGRRLLPEIVEHLRWYERTIGPYPFRADKYGVTQTPFLGMEHQTVIAYGAGFDNGAMTDGVDWGFDALHHHELSHEWWGNLVTAADFKDLWLHEGFGTYMQPLYLESLRGPAAYRAYLLSLLGGLAHEAPVAPRESRTVDEVYAGDIYGKGAWVLHSLRHVIGDEAFTAALRRMAYPDPRLHAVTDGSHARFATTGDFVRIAEDASGMELDWFFEVYLRQPRLPVLRVSRTASALLLRWEAPRGLPFPMPLEVEIGGSVRRVGMPDGSATVPLAGSEEVVIDPHHWVLKALPAGTAPADVRGPRAPS